jgi:anti-anti-sigma factor
MEPLQYFLSEKKGIAVVSFAGKLSRENEPVLQQCAAELIEKRPKFVILYLRDLGSRMDIAALPAFARLQKAVRELPAEMKVCSPHPELRALLEEKGLLRPNELCNNLVEALQALPIVAGKP